MSSTSSTASPPTQLFALALLPILTLTLIVFMVTGLALPVLPLHVHDRLGMGTVMVGLVTGAQFAAALVSRVWSGQVSDTQGAKRAVVAGMLTAVASGLLYFISLSVTAMPLLSAGILLAGRALLGGAESFVITGALSWGLVLAGPKNTGRAIAWIGMAMYVAFAVGAPIGTALYLRYGFAAIAWATMAFPLLGLLMMTPMRAPAAAGQARPSFAKVIRAVLRPGLGLALSSLGFGAITTFIALLFSTHGWQAAWLALSGFSGAFVLARLFFGHLPDRMGGARVALACLLIEAAGQALIWIAPGPACAVAGAVLTGFGYSLVYPGLGIEAVRAVPEENRGLAMGAYTAFFDLALGLAGPLLGWIASGAGIASVFLVSAAVVLCATAIAFPLAQGKARL